MPFLFISAGLLLTIAAVRGTNDDLLALLKADVTGKNNFIYWMVAILIVGALGYIPAIKPLSRAFLVLVVVVLFLKSGGVFQQFTSALSTTQTVNKTAANTSASTVNALPSLASLEGELTA